MAARDSRSLWVTLRLITGWFCALFRGHLGLFLLSLVSLVRRLRPAFPYAGRHDRAVRAEELRRGAVAGPGGEPETGRLGRETGLGVDRRAGRPDQPPARLHRGVPHPARPVR